MLDTGAVLHWYADGVVKPAGWTHEMDSIQNNGSPNSFCTLVTSFDLDSTTGTVARTRFEEKTFVTSFASWVLRVVLSMTTVRFQSWNGRRTELVKSLGRKLVRGNFSKGLVALLFYSFR